MVTLFSVAGSHLCSLTFGSPSSPLISSSVRRFDHQPGVAGGGRGRMLSDVNASETILLAVQAEAERDRKLQHVGL